MLHPDYLCEQLTASQIAGWARYQLHEPFGEERADLRAEATAQRHARDMADEVRAIWPYWPPQKSEYEKLLEAQQEAKRRKAMRG